MNWQTDSILNFQQIANVTALMQAFSFLGREEFFLLLIPLVYLSIDTRTGIRLGVLLLLGDALNVLFKIAFHAPRPYWIDHRIQPLATETSYGLPSSHAQNALSIWLFLALLAKRPWAVIAAGCLIFLISVSRVFLGVHFWTDILGGWAIGLLLLLLFLRYWPRFESWFVIQKLRTQIVTVTGVSLSMLMLGFILQGVPTGIDEPAAWAHYASEARTLEPLFGRCGALFGLGIGWAMSLRCVRFEAGGTMLQRIIRFIIGLAGVLFCWKGLQILLPHEPESVEFFFRFLRYALLAFWVTFLAPLLFLKLKLAEPAKTAN